MILFNIVACGQNLPFKVGYVWEGKSALALNRNKKNVDDLACGILHA
jgi:hypothetical protein